MELLHSVLGTIFAKKYGRHEMVLTHLSVEAFVCILPEHLGIPPERGDLKWRRRKIEN